VNKAWCAAAAMGLVLGLAAPGSAGDVKLEIRDGRVTLDARDVTVRQILAEWARVGRTKVVNGEKIAGGPVTIQLKNVPEWQALDTLLRSVTGYMAAPRPQPASDGSIYDRILVMPTARAASAATPAPAAPEPMNRFRGNFSRPAEDQDDMFPGPNNPNSPNAFQNPMGPMMQAIPPGVPGITAPASGGVYPQQGGMGAPGAAGGTASPNTSQPYVPAGGVQVPGQVVQPPKQQVPGQVVQPPRPPGGGD
jgi:hypothetical protein